MSPHLIDYDTFRIEALVTVVAGASIFFVYS